MLPSNGSTGEIERIEKVLSVILSGKVRSVRMPTAARVGSDADTERRADGTIVAGPSPSSHTMIHLEFPRTPTAVTLHQYVRQMSSQGKLTQSIRIQLAVELLAAMTFLHVNGLPNRLTSDDISVLPEAIGTANRFCLCRIFWCECAGPALQRTCAAGTTVLGDLRR